MKANLTIAATLLILSGLLPTKAEAAVLTLQDFWNGTDNTGPLAATWTLDVETGCTTCAVKLQVVFSNPTAYAGTYLDSVEWRIENPNVAPTSDAGIGFNGTTAGTKADWTFKLSGLNSNQCNDNSGKDGTCGEWISGGPGEGFGPLVNGSTLEWTFSTTFESALPATLTSGNIRAAFNNECTTETKNGEIVTTCQNFNIFSPGGGTFVNDDGGQGDDGATLPEPASLLLLGVGFGAAAFGARRRAPRT